MIGALLGLVGGTALVAAGVEIAGRMLGLEDLPFDLVQAVLLIPAAVVALTGTLAAGSTLVIVNAAITTSVTVANSITSTVTYFNGDDAITLEKSGVIVDQIGVVG